MVQAILAGRKTQTRRVVKPAPVSRGYRPLVSSNKGIWEWSFGPDDRKPNGDLRWWRPLCQPGDTIWVRENWQGDVEYGATPPRDIPAGQPIWYEAGGGKNVGSMAVKCGGWRPSIHMPRWASRITLRCTDVRVERLNDCSEADAIAEGLEVRNGILFRGAADLPWRAKFPTVAYSDLWEHINGDGSWAANPWVWVICFERVQP